MTYKWWSAMVIKTQQNKIRNDDDETDESPLTRNRLTQIEVWRETRVERGAGSSVAEPRSLGNIPPGES